MCESGKGSFHRGTIALCLWKMTIPLSDIKLADVYCEREESRVPFDSISDWYYKCACEIRLYLGWTLQVSVSNPTLSRISD